MKDNVQSTRQNTWASRLRRTLVVWDDAINIGPVESIERRVSALEQRVRELEEEIR
jgi:polyhydroxyalkanoate synthesis regulator phasin